MQHSCHIWIWSIFQKQSGFTGGNTAAWCDQFPHAGDHFLQNCEGPQEMRET